MTAKERAVKFGQDGLALLERRGESEDVLAQLYAWALPLTRNASERRLRTCEFIGAVLDVQTQCDGVLRLVMQCPARSGLLDPAAYRREKWDLLRTILRELAGLEPLQTYARHRAKWTGHWQYLCVTGDARMRKEVLKTALKRYPDFDVTLLQSTRPSANDVPVPANDAPMPMRPLLRDARGVVRFKENAVVTWLFNSNRLDLNAIPVRQLPVADVEEFWQMLGYSVGGYADLSFIRAETKDCADAECERLLKEPPC